MRRTSCLTLLAAATTIVASAAASQEVRAVALDRETKQPVADIRVSLLSRKREELDSARTAIDGSFTLRAKQGGKYFIQVSRPGHPAEESDAIFLEKGEIRNDTLYVTAARVLQRVEDVIGREIFRLFGVTASSLPPRALILPEQIESVRASARSASDIVLQKGPPYLRVLGLGTGRVCYQIYGGDCARVYLNGQQVLTAADLPAGDLEAVAVLTPSAVQTTLGNSTGVVMLWTRGMLKTAR